MQASAVAYAQRDDDTLSVADLILVYEKGVEELRVAVAGITGEQLRSRSVAGKWSTLEVVCHLADCEQFIDGPLVGNCGYIKETAEKAIAEGHADLISFGRPFISNPDLVERFSNGWPLAEPAPKSDWSSPTGAKGYTD